MYYIGKAMCRWVKNFEFYTKKNGHRVKCAQMWVRLFLAICGARLAHLFILVDSAYAQILSIETFNATPRTSSYVTVNITDTT